jgi:hypothetical protein
MPVTDLEQPHAELRAALMLAGKQIVKLSFVGKTIQSCASCAAYCATRGRALSGRVLRYECGSNQTENSSRYLRLTPD